MPTGLYTRWEYDSKTDRFIVRNYKNKNFREQGNVLLLRIEIKTSLSTDFLLEKMKNGSVFAM